MKKTPVIALMVATLMVTSTALAAPAPPQQRGGMRATPAQQHYQPLPVQPKPAMPREGYSRHHNHHGDSLLAGMLGVVIGAVIGSVATN